jgi:hypothetical protein
MTYNRFAAFADNGGMSFEKYTPAVSRTAKPINRKPRRDDDDDDVINDITIPNMKRMTDPFAKMLDRQALAYQAQFGGSYEQAYVKIYEDPSNRSIVDAAKSEHLAQGEDAISGTRLSMVPAQKAAPSEQDYVARAIESRGPAHAKLHQMALEHSRAHPELTYAQAYTNLFTAPGNTALRAGIAAESGIRTLSLEEAMALAPAKPFPRYSAPGHSGEAGNVGTSGRKPPNYAGG